MVAPRPWNRHRSILWADVRDVEDWTLNGPYLDGISFVSGLKSVAVMYLLLMGPVRALNRSMEEAALLSGASRLRLFLDINIPILLPTLSGLAILGFVNSLGQLDVALILGVPAGIYVFPTQIYDFLATTPIRYDSASALALLLIAIIYLLVMIRSKALGNRNFITVTGNRDVLRAEHFERMKDGAVLADTLAGVLDRYPELASLCVVPLGVSRHNTEARMRPSTPTEAGEFRSLFPGCDGTREVDPWTAASSAGGGSRWAAGSCSPTTGP